MAQTVLVDTSWAWLSFLTCYCQSLSTSAAISAIEALALRCLWSATTSFPPSPCHGRPSLQLHAFSTVFLAVERNFTNLLWWRMDRVKRERWTVNRQCQSWWQVKRGLKQNLRQVDVSSNDIYSCNLPVNSSSRYSRHQGYKISKPTSYISIRYRYSEVC